MFTFYWTGSNLDQERIDVCKQELIVTETYIFFEVRHPRCVSNKSKCNVYTICRQTQLSNRWYTNLLNVNFNYMFRPQSLAIIRLYKRKLIN